MKKYYILTLILFISFIIFFNISFSENKKAWTKFPLFSDQKLEIKSIIIDYSELPDDSIEKFIWINKPFHNIQYEPSDLVSLKWYPHITAQAKHTLRKEAAYNLERMANAFYSEFWKNLVVVSAYRSYSYQKNSISKKCKQSWRCAKEWESEHQLGLAVDLRETTNEQKFLAKYQKYYNRLHNNAHLYWFHQSFQNWREIDWYYIEPRHWRYLGIDMAMKLREKNITFTQYVNILQNYLKIFYSIW